MVKMSRNYYQILEIPREATDSDIKKAYRKLALKYHPDKNSSHDAEEKFKEIAEAYDVLGSADKRAAYDRDLRGGDAHHRRSSHGRRTYHEFHKFHTIDPFEIFRSFFGMHDPFARAFDHHTRLDPFRRDPFKDPFANLFSKHHQHSFAPHRSLFDDKVFNDIGSDKPATKSQITVFSKNGGTVQITRTVVGKDGSVRRETRFQAASSPPSSPAKTEISATTAKPTREPAFEKPSTTSKHQRANDSVDNSNPEKNNHNKRMTQQKRNFPLTEVGSPKPSTRSSSHGPQKSRTHSDSPSPLKSPAFVRKHAEEKLNTVKSTEGRVSSPGGFKSNSTSRQKSASSGVRSGSSTPTYAAPTFSSIRRGNQTPNSVADKPSPYSSHHRARHSTPLKPNLLNRDKSSPRSNSVKEISVKCPLCGRYFKKSVVESHASSCEGPSPPQSTILTSDL